MPTYCRKPRWVAPEFPDAVLLAANENKQSLFGNDYGVSNGTQEKIVGFDSGQSFNSHEMTKSCLCHQQAVQSNTGH